MIEQTADPSKLGFDPDRLARFRPWMQRWVDAGKYPGAQVVIARRGEVVFRDCVGLCDLETGRPWQQDTLVRIYSMTKPVATVALLMLYEDALCHLDTPVDEFLPELADRQVLVSGAVDIDQVQPAATRLTLHHLLTHTSGFTYGFNEGLLPKAMRDRGVNFSDKTGDLAAMVGKLSALPLAFEPGRRWNYGVSTDVIGRVVEVVSGQPLDRFLAERIFEPLGMVDTAFDVPDGKLGRLASCYDKTGKELMNLADPAGDSAFRAGRVTLYSGGGGLVSTADDYLRFAEMLRGGGALGEARLLAPKTVELMTRNALPGDLASMGQAVFAEVSFDGIGFGLGVAVTVDPAIAKSASSGGDFGWGGLASTMFWVDPAAELSAIFLTQLMPSSAYPNRKEMRALTYSSLTDP